MVFFVIDKLFSGKKMLLRKRLWKFMIFTCNISVHPLSLQKRSNVSNWIRIVKLLHEQTNRTTKVDQYRFFKNVNSSFAKQIEYHLLLCERNIDKLNNSWAMPKHVCIFLITVSPRISTLLLCANKATLMIWRKHVNNNFHW